MNAARVRLAALLAIAGLALVAVLGTAAPAAAAKGPKPNSEVRVFAMGAKLNMRWLESRQTYRDYLFALADRRERGDGAPVITRGADDMASHLTGNDLVVWPESIGLFAALTGPRAEPARDSGSLEGAIVTLIGLYGKENSYYGAKYPELTARPPSTRLLAVSLTDTFGRTFIEPFAAMADRYDTWLVTVGDMVTEWQIVCEDMDAYEPPPTGEPCAEENPQKVARLGDPFEPGRDYAYEATSDEPSVAAFVFNPDGEIVASRAKSYLVPTELGQEEGQLALDLVPGAVSDADSRPVTTPVGRLGFVISKPAWMPDVTQKLDQRRTDVLVQPELFVGNLVSTEGMWNPDVLLASGYSDVLRHPSLNTLVHPQMQGGIFSFYADHPSHLAIKPRTGREPRGQILGQPPQPGLVQTLPWVVPDPLRPGEPFAERRRRLGEAGEALAPGSGVECPDPAEPGPCEDGHTEGVLWRDVTVNRKPRYRRYSGPARPTPFTPAKPLAPSGKLQRNVAVARHGRHLAAAYEELRGGRARVRLVTSDDGGRSWSRPRRPSAPAGPGRAAARSESWWPSVAVGPGGRTTVAWVDRTAGRQRVLFSRSGPGGRRFGPARPLDPSPPPGVAQWKPVLAQDTRRPGVVHAAFVDERESHPGGLPQANVYYVRITGGKPGAATRLDTGEPAPLASKLDNSWTPSIASRGRKVLVAWIDFLNYDWDVFARSSADGGQSWGAQRLVNDTPPEDESISDSPRALISGGRELVAWTDFRMRDSSATRPHQMYDTYIAEVGGPNAQVDPYGRKQVSTFSPDACATGKRGKGGALVAFQDASRGQNDVRAALVDGAGEAGRAFRVDDAGRRGGNAWRPRLACGKRGAVALWEDERDGPAQIYFARARLGKLTKLP